MIKPSVAEVVSIAMEISKEDPIDFGMLNINEEESFKLIALGVLDNPEFFDPEIGNTLLVASLVRSIVENFVLNLKLLNKGTLH
jgi:hypothetical protein